VNRLLRGAFLAGATLAAALSLALAGCAPPYIEALDKAAPLIRQMRAVGTIGSVSLGNSQTNTRFLPTKPTAASLGPGDVQSGFLIQDGGGNEYVSFVYTDSSGQAQNSNSQSFSLAGADPNFPLYQYEVAATTTTANLVVFYMNPTTASSNSAQLLTSSASSGSLAVTAGPATLTSYTGGVFSVIGEQVVPTVSGGPDNFRWFCSDGLGNFSQVPTYSLAVPPAVFNTNAVAGAPLAIPAVNRYMYYTTLVRGYAEYFSGGQWVCYDISGAPVILGGIRHRIDALLSTGDLLSTEGGAFTLYDPSGSQLFSVASDGLQFCYEAYIGSTPYVFFSLPMQVAHGNWLFNVYAVPTSSLRSLGG
jgi:hypothetical protein